MKIPAIPGLRPKIQDPSGDRADLVVAPVMDERFRKVCAVFSDGRCLIAAGHQTDNRLRSRLLLLRHAGSLPDQLREETASLDDIAACWRKARRSTGPLDDAIASRVGYLLDEAATARASDIVFENEDGLCRVYGIINDRKLPLVRSLTAEEGREVMGFLFHCKDEGSAQTSYQHNTFQGFSIRAGGRVPLPASVSALRCQRGPHEPDGDHLFARMFYRDQTREGLTLADLGFTSGEAEIFSEIRTSLHGGIFLGGTAGDGKSTTLAVNLGLQMAEMNGHLNVVTIEDPVEYPIPGALQIAVPTTGSGEERGRHFKEALMHFCRVHPASGMVSEIRDADAARQVLQFIDTGHQVWTTIHVHSANAILFRLIDMGVSAAEVCKPGNIRLLMKQTLLPRLCPSCATNTPCGDRPIPAWLGRVLNGRDVIRFRNPDGCSDCSREGQGEAGRKAWNGYIRQSAIAEMIRPDAEYLSFVRAHDPAGAWADWTGRLGGVPLGTRIWAEVLNGAADPFDALFKGATAPDIADPELQDPGLATGALMP